jgi:excinuclease ABC subunit B
MNADALEKVIENTQIAMKKAAKELDFIEAARLRDEMYELQKLLKVKKS